MNTKTQYTAEQFMTLATGLLAPRTADRIVSHQMGSWKWQAAWRVVRYFMKRRKRDGWPIWYSARQVCGKSSMPQLRRFGLADLPKGSLHNAVVQVKH